MHATRPTRRLRAALAALTGAALAATLAVAAGHAPSAAADTRPPDVGAPVTVSSDPLPTVQIDGVVWTQTVVGDTVYAGGDFDTARPAGNAPGVGTVPRHNLLAYSISTGVLVSRSCPTSTARCVPSWPRPTAARCTSGGSSPGRTGRAGRASRPTT
ncbi:hypothetical protein GCM10025868_14820 [Angustibacter aerolatus]|uniref:Uncharacterized protein n=1 Tax=Angustibacter aerolatus TaxID=1162965 RepID=A0ABQ6JDG7_9ACTN|nr:hypothetical protein [Angustibacter aerolatus]GMA86232.1 hypothetical protein GCM10025868_14820 [Angustibacter aerolatus]